MLFLREQTNNMKSLFSILSLVVICACNNRDPQKVHLPSQHYEYVHLDTAALPSKHTVYAPVYSHIYIENGTSVYNLSATLSVRNTSFTDSFYVTGVSYYGSQGELLKQYLDSTVLVKPMASIEFVVERTENKGGAGANFIVHWGAHKQGLQPLFQTVMNQAATGISFITNGIEINSQ